MNEPKPGAANAHLRGRIAVGFVQGALLYWTANFRADAPQLSFTEPQWRQFMEMARTVAVFAPLPLLFGIGNLPPLRLAIWSAAAAAGLAFVGWLAPAPVWAEAPPVVTVWLFSLIVIYIVHEFLQAAHDDSRPVARYETYFDVAWRHGFQAVLALGFVVAFWIVLGLGAFLFNLIGVDAFENVIRSDEFRWIASAAAFALGIHWTDADSGLTRGARQIGLALLSWLSILLTLILTAFLVALPFTGLEPLWDTKRATVLLLNAAATMILLINAAFQAGEPPQSRAIRAVARFSALPLAGIVALAAIGLWLRVDQYGLTPARVVAGAELAIVAFYAAGYVAAAILPGAWMALIKPVNIAGAALVAAILFALMTPIADPARLSVAGQVARLERGEVEPDDFDFGFLADARSRHWGPNALAKLAAKSGDPRNDRIAFLARNPGERKPYGLERQTFNDRKRSVVLIGPGEIPEAALLPPKGGPDPIGDCAAAVLAAEERVAIETEENRRRARLSRPPAPPADPASRPLMAAETRCSARHLDLDRDGAEDDLLILSAPEPYNRSRNIHALVGGANNVWAALGSGHATARPAANVTEMLDQAAADLVSATAVQPDRLDFMVDNRRIRFFPSRATLSSEEMRAALDMRGPGEPPGYLLQDRALHGLVSDCATAQPAEWGVKPACFGRHLDATGDGAAEFVLARFAARYAAEIQIFAKAENDWTPLGTAHAPDSRPEFPYPTGDPRWKAIAAEIANARAEIFDAMTTSPPLLADIEIGGERVIFEYASGEREREAEILEPNR